MKLSMLQCMHAYKCTVTKQFVPAVTALAHVSVTTSVSCTMHSISQCAHSSSLDKHYSIIKSVQQHSGIALKGSHNDSSQCISVCTLCIDMLWHHSSECYRTAPAPLHRSINRSK
jgi:hypothetical protein